jgi:hypothetical protein
MIHPAPVSRAACDEFLFASGISRIVDEIIKKTDPFYLAAVYGWPNSGKSRLISDLRVQLEQLGHEVIEVGAIPATYEALKSWMETARARTKPDPQRRIILFHVTAPRGIKEETSEALDPNEGLSAIGVKVDLNVGIYNPHTYGPYEGSYDFLIRNPDAN